MKKLNKLQINSEKLMRSEELVMVKGGSGPCTCCCYDQVRMCAYGSGY